MVDVPIEFDFDGKRYKGAFSPVKGGGTAHLWHLMIDNYYWGQLFYGQGWTFGSNVYPDLSEYAEYFGWVVTAWSEISPE